MPEPLLPKGWHVVSYTQYGGLMECPCLYYVTGEPTERVRGIGENREEAFADACEKIALMRKEHDQ